MVGFSSETAERGGWLCRISDDFVNTWGCQNGGTWSLSLSDQNSHGETKMVQKNMDDVLLE